MIIYQIITYIFLFIILFIPDQGKNHLALVSAIGMLSISLLSIFVNNFWQNISRKDDVTIFFLLFIVASAISTFFSEDRNLSLVQLMFFIFCFVIFTSIRSVFPNHKQKELFVLGYLLFTIILSSISLYNTLIAQDIARTHGLSFMWIYYGHNHLSAILLFTIPVTFYFLWNNWKSKIFRYIFLLISGHILFAMYFTFARASMFSLFLATLFALIIFVKRKLTFKTIICVRIIVAVLLLLFGVLLTSTNNFTTKIPFRFDETNMRIIYWQQAIINFKSHFLFGSGLDTFNLKSHLPAYLKDKDYMRSSYVHNFFLQILSDAGILGFLTSIMLIFITLQRIVRKIIAKSTIVLSDKYLSIALFVGILASTINALVDFDWQIPTVFLIFWVIVGLIV